MPLNDLKALRNRANRADGGIGRKLTLDVLQTQFGKGLKEAADSLGMCATTLKRACRRLGVRRWPRTPESAVQVRTHTILSPVFDVTSCDLAVTACMSYNASLEAPAVRTAV